MNKTIPASENELILFGRDGKLNPIRRENWGAKYDTLIRLKGIANTRILVDVGANIGQTMIEAFAFNRSIKYLGFEPNPTAFYFLQSVAKANNFDVTLFPWACSDISSPIKMHAMGPVDSAATIKPEIRNNTYGKTPGFWISSYPLDLISENLSLENNFILKIDVEGAEYSVISGALKTIEKYRPAIICEILNAHSVDEINNNNINKINIERFCRYYDYKIYQKMFAPGDAHGNGRLVSLKSCSTLPKSILYKDYPALNDYLFMPGEFQALNFTI